MTEIGIIALLLTSIALGLVVAWRVARKHKTFYAVGSGLFATCALYAILVLQASYDIASAKKAGCWEWCDMAYLLYGGMAVIAAVIVLIGGSIIAVLVHRRTRVNNTSAVS